MNAMANVIQKCENNTWRFQQDNNLKHTDRIAKTFLAETYRNLWGIAKHNVEKRIPTNINESNRYSSKLYIV